jgi:hypothetical protein
VRSGLHKWAKDHVHDHIHGHGHSHGSGHVHDIFLWETRVSCVLCRVGEPDTSPVQEANESVTKLRYAENFSTDAGPESREPARAG